MSPRKEHPKWLRIFLRYISITCFTIACLYVLTTFIARALILASISPLPLSLPTLSKVEAFAFFVLCPFFGLLNYERRWLNIPLGGFLAAFGIGIFFAARHGAEASLNAAVCIFCLGLAAMVVGIWREARYTPTAVATLGSLVFAIAVLTLLGHITGATLAYYWNGSVGMSLEAACGFIVCGLGLIAWSIDGTQRVSSIAWLAIPVFTVFETATIGLWMALYMNQSEQVRSLIAAHTDTIRVELETALRSNVNALERMARTWERFGRPSKEQWLFDANLLLKDLRGFSTIAWVDESLYIRWAASTDPSAILEGRSIAFEPHRVAAIKQARSERSTIASAPVDLLTDGRGVALFVPIYSGQKQDGFVEAGLSVSQVLSELGAVTHNSDFLLTVEAQGEALFQLQNIALTTFGQSVTFDLYGSRWRVDVAPTQAFLSRNKTTLPEQVLLAGSLIALALAGVTAVTQSLANRRRLSEEMNRNLEETIKKLSATEKALSNSQERLSVALQGANLALWEWDMKFQIAYYSPLWKSQLGFEESEITSSPDEWTSRVHPSDLPATLQAFQNFNRNPTPDFEVEYRLRHKSGEYRWVLTRAHVYRDKQGAIEGSVGINIDITPRKAADERFARLLEAAPDGLVIISENGKILHANSQTVALFGYAHDELIGKDIELLVPESSRDRHRFMRLGFMASRETRRMGGGRELFGLRKDGTTFYAEISLSPVVSDSEKLAVAAVRDISDRKRVEVELKKAKNLAEQASQTKSIFLANMSHEIRTPLGVILGHAELLSSPTVTEANRLSYAAAILRNGENLIALINDLLDLSKIEAGGLEVEMVRTGLVPIVHDALTLLEIKAAQKGLYLKLLDESLIPETIETDGTRLRQIMINVIGNAVKFTSHGGIDVLIRPVIDTRSRELKCLQIDVRDTGCGLTSENFTKIFEPFSQADSSITRKFGGTGLGLSLSRRLARLLDGDVALVESKVDRGSLFRITVSAGDLSSINLIRGADIGKHVPEQVRFKDESRSLEDLEVLLVEDFEDNQKMMMAFLSSAGAQVELASNGQEALRKGQAYRYDVILMDIQMPLMNGYDATKALRKAGYQGPIVALTAHAMKGEREQCLDAGFTDHLSKPVSRDNLIQAVALHGRTSRRVESRFQAPEETVDASAIPVSPLLDDPYMRDAVIFFVNKIGDRVNQMRKLLENGKIEDIRRLAHQLKGSGGSAGYMIITGDAAEIERAAHEGGSVDAIRPLLNTLSQHAKSIEDGLRQKLDNPSLH